MKKYKNKKIISLEFKIHSKFDVKPKIWNS